MPRLPEVKWCLRCGTKFKPNSWNQNFCSHDCYEEDNRERMREYYRVRHPEEKVELEPRTKFLQEIAKRQQEIPDIYIRKTYCEACGIHENEEIKPRMYARMVLHHISYYPIETVTLCTHCHGLLHFQFLDGRKCRPKMSVTKP